MLLDNGSDTVKQFDMDWVSFEYLKHQTDERRELLELTDVLVDGLLCTNFINLICHIKGH